MTLQEIHDMAADALAGEELQLCDGGTWLTAKGQNLTPFNPDYEWRIKPTIEVNGVMLTKRQAKAAWGLSGATSYTFELAGSWRPSHDKQPDFTGTKYRWETPKWIYVNGEKIVRSGGHVFCHNIPVANDTDVQKLQAAIYKLIEIK
jgi:hypothetical protein